MRSPWKIAAGLVALWLIAGCQSGPQPDAYGNVEAVDVIVGAEATGQILSFLPDDGMHLAAGQLVGTIDTSQLVLQREQIGREATATGAQQSEVARQIDQLAIERDIARRAYERTRRLYDEKAATAQQLDQAERDYRSLDEQIKGSQAKTQTIRANVTSVNARIAQINDQIAKAQIHNPINGTVLAHYVKAGEFTSPGQPLYRIADLSTVQVRAYVGEPELTHIRIGQRANVSIDVGKNKREVFPGTLTWISSEAEFTPTPVETRQERADLVYAVKISVPNSNGILKIGMPADVTFAKASR